MDFHYTVESSKTVDQLISDLEKALQEIKFGVLWQFDIKEKLNAKGLDFEPQYKVLEVCNPFEASRVLQEDQMVGYFLPCKIVVYEDGGKTKVGLPKPTALISMVDNDNLKSIAADIEKRLVDTLEKVK